MATVVTRDDKQVISWLLIGCFLIAAMVVIGGITRLTHSGLSMVDWKLIMGILPPLDEAAWVAKFEQYKQFPEYRLKHSHFTLSDFKSIFWWEYLHRLLGRLIGLIFIVPYIYFLIKKKFRPGFTKKTLILFLLGAFQGFLGWYMVKSGLVKRPDVSHYRLAIHLVAALVLYSYTLWLALDLIYQDKRSDLENNSLLVNSYLFLFIITLQIIYGAFVAGLKAGLFFPTFPKMGSEWMPAQIFTAFNEMGFISLVQDLVAVQFIHRTLGILTLLFLIYLWISSLKLDLTREQKFGVNALVIITFAQFLLGVATLLMGVPVSLGVLHQFGALLLVSSLIYLIHRLRVA